jgi:integrase
VVNSYLTPKLADKPVPHIGRKDLQPIIDDIPVKRRGMRRAVFAYASILFGWANQRGDIAENPLLSMVKPEAPKARDRVLSDDELATLWKASVGLRGPFGAFIRLLILTGQRRSEVGRMAWSELDRATAIWIIPGGRAKNDIAHIVPLTPAVIEEIDRLALALQLKDRINDVDGTRWPNPPGAHHEWQSAYRGNHQDQEGFGYCCHKARGGTAIEAWRLHDLRRTLATGFQKLGVRFEVTEAVLNHISGAKSGVAGIYQRHDWRGKADGAGGMGPARRGDPEVRRGNECGAYRHCHEIDGLAPDNAGRS